MAANNEIMYDFFLSYNRERDDVEELLAQLRERNLRIACSPDVDLIGQSSIFLCYYTINYANIGEIEQSGELEKPMCVLKMEDIDWFETMAGQFINAYHLRAQIIQYDLRAVIAINGELVENILNRIRDNWNMHFPINPLLREEREQVQERAPIELEREPPNEQANGRNVMELFKVFINFSFFVFEHFRHLFLMLINTVQGLHLHLECCVTLNYYQHDHTHT